MGAKKKLRKRMIRHVLDGTLSVNAARAVLGKRPLPAPRRAGAPYRAPQRQGAMAVKSAGQAQRPGGPVPIPRLEQMAEYLADPMMRETARTYSYGLDSGARSWAPPPPGLVQKAETSADPYERERARAAISKSMTGPAQPAPVSLRALTWGTGPDGQAGWQRTSQPGAPGLQIAVPGMAGR